LSSRERTVAEATAVLRGFLAGGQTLHVPDADTPLVSVILVLFNRAELTLRCLRSLAEQRVPLEVVVVDNASSDETPLLLSRAPGARVIRSATNDGFLLGVNRAARRARGRHLLLLNNDAELLPGSLECGLAALQGSDGVGAVGGRLILPDGTLQEAGSIVWRDGGCLGYGRGGDPFAPEFMFRRDVDYVSGALLLTPRQLFLELGAFDAGYAPAYYEEVDYCVRLWRSGRRVVYEPHFAAHHFEFASSASMDAAVAMQLARRRVFVERHGEWLKDQAPPEPARALHVRSRRRAGGRVLYVDDRVPQRRLGSGLPRSLDLLQALVSLGHETTLYPLSFPHQEWHEVYREVPVEVEVMLGRGREGFLPLWRERAGFYDCVVVSRDHNLELMLEAPGAPRPLFGDTPLVFDAEAVVAPREVAQRRLSGEAVSDAEAQELLRAELRLAQTAGAAVVTAVSEADRRWLASAGAESVVVLGAVAEPAPTEAGFDAREGFLFVGATHEDSSPNADGLVWFADEVLPLLRARLGDGVRLRVAGLNLSAQVEERAARGAFELLGPVEDLRPLYEAARVFVAPARFAAGIPLKVLDAAAHGVPVASTAVLAQQLGWSHGQELLAADAARALAEACLALHGDAVLWRRLRQSALERVGRDHSRAAFTARLAEALALAGAARRARIA
jgi:GT2 family glycosyltransferase